MLQAALDDSAALAQMLASQSIMAIRKQETVLQLTAITGLDVQTVQAAVDLAIPIALPARAVSPLMPVTRSAMPFALDIPIGTNFTPFTGGGGGFGVPVGTGNPLIDLANVAAMFFLARQQQQAAPAMFAGAGGASQLAAFCAQNPALCAGANAAAAGLVPGGMVANALGLTQGQANALIADMPIGIGCNAPRLPATVTQIDPRTGKMVRYTRDSLVALKRTDLSAAKRVNRVARRARGATRRRSSPYTTLCGRCFRTMNHCSCSNHGGGS